MKEKFLKWINKASNKWLDYFPKWIVNMDDDKKRKVAIRVLNFISVLGGIFFFLILFIKDYGYSFVNYPLYIIFIILFILGIVISFKKEI